MCRSLGESKWRALFATIISKCENYCTSNTPLSERGEKGGNGHVLVEDLVVLDDGVVGTSRGKDERRDAVWMGDVLVAVLNVCLCICWTNKSIEKCAFQ